MDAQLIQLISDCLSIATERGVATGTPVVIALNTGESSSVKTRVVVAYDEPTQILPLNVTWIVADPVDADYQKAFKRASKTPNNGFNNTWVELSLYSEVFTPGQYYDGTDLPKVESTLDEMEDHITDPNNPHEGAVSKSGDTLLGPLIARTLGQGDSYASDELIPKSELASLAMWANVVGLYGGLNNRVSYNNYLIGLLGQTDSSHSTSIADLVARIDALESAPAPSVESQTLVVSEANKVDTWIIEHNWGTRSVIVQVFDGEDEVMLPAEVKPIDDNHIQISFLFAEFGKATVLKVA